MRNRWYHKPLFHIHNTHREKRATWLELFYDLIFVAAFIQLGNGLSKYISFSGFFIFAAIFATIWFIWTGFSYYMNRYTVDDFLHRLMVFIQMFAVGAMAVAAPDVFKGKISLFMISNSIALLMVALMYLRSYKQQSIGRPYCIYWGSVFGFSALVAAIAALVPAPFSYGFWLFGFLSISVSPYFKRSQELLQSFPLDQEHLSERYGILTIIVLGESFVKVLSSLSGSSGELTLIMQAIFVLFITCSLWWIYFDDVAGAHLKQGKFSPIIWFYSHLPLHIGITAVGVAIKKAVHFDLAAAVPIKYGMFLCLSLGLTYLAVAIIDSVTERKQAELNDNLRINIRVFSTVLLVLFAFTATGLNAKWFLLIIMLINVAQVLFDMLSAPFEESDEDDMAVSVAHIARTRQDEGQSKFDEQLKLSNFVIKGQLNEFRKDLYFYLMEGSWLRVFSVISFSYVLINILFACLYLLAPDSISTPATQSFTNAFFFSVQTMSTIGYGVLSPESTYANLLVTVESGVGIFFVAIITGIIFAKASRPKSSVIFSENIVIGTRNGQKELSFRVGNARGNDVVDASISVSVLIDELSEEGNHIRRLHDLKLSRDRSPLFVLSWSVMHDIDEQSPLHNVDLSDPNNNIISFVVTLTGHDGTYGQTIYARHLYTKTDVREGASFVDVISQLPDGRLMIDFDKFHELKA